MALEPHKKTPVLAAPKGTEKQGDTVLVASGATGPFAGKSGALATKAADGSWTFVTPFLPHCSNFSELQQALIDRGWMSPV